MPIIRDPESTTVLEESETTGVSDIFFDRTGRISKANRRETLGSTSNVFGGPGGTSGGDPEGVAERDLNLAPEGPVITPVLDENTIRDEGQIVRDAIANGNLNVADLQPETIALYGLQDLSDDIGDILEPIEPKTTGDLYQDYLDNGGTAAIGEWVFIGKPTGPAEPVTPTAPEPEPVIEPDTVDADLNALYQELLNREIGPVGLEGWGKVLRSGQMTLEQVREAILGSQEFKNLNPEISDILDPGLPPETPEIEDPVIAEPVVEAPVITEPVIEDVVIESPVIDEAIDDIIGDDIADILDTGVIVTDDGLVDAGTTDDDSLVTIIPDTKTTGELYQDYLDNGGTAAIGEWVFIGKPTGPTDTVGGDVLDDPTQEAPEETTDGHPIIDTVIDILTDVITPGIDLGGIFDGGDEEADEEEVADILDTGVIVTDEGLVDPGTTDDPSLVTIIPDVNIGDILDGTGDGGTGDGQVITNDGTGGDGTGTGVNIVVDILTGAGDDDGDDVDLIPTIPPDDEEEDEDTDLIPTLITDGIDDILDGGDEVIIEEDVEDTDLLPTIPPDDPKPPEEPEMGELSDFFSEINLTDLISNVGNTVLNVNAAEDAAEFGLKGTQEAIAFLEKQSALNRADTQPFIDVGKEAERGTRTFDDRFFPTPSPDKVTLDPTLRNLPSEGITRGSLAPGSLDLPALTAPETIAGAGQNVDIGQFGRGDLKNVTALNKGNLQEITLPNGEKIHIPLEQLQQITQGRTPGQLDPFDLQNPLTKSLIEESLTEINNLAAAEGRFGAGGTDVLRGKGVGQAILRGAKDIEAVNASRSQRRLAEEQQEFNQALDVNVTDFSQRRAFRQDLEGEDQAKFDREAAKRGIIFKEDREITSVELQQRAQEFDELITSGNLTFDQQLEFRQQLNDEEKQLFDTLSGVRRQLTDEQTQEFAILAKNRELLNAEEQAEFDRALANRETLFNEQFAKAAFKASENQRVFEGLFNINAKEFQQKMNMDDANFDELIKLLTIGANTAVGAGTNQVALASSIAGGIAGQGAISADAALATGTALGGGLTGILGALFPKT